MTDWQDSITDVTGILVGHAQDEQALTGCSVILCKGGAVGGVDSRGGAPGTRETDLLHPGHMVQKVHAVLLSGGSAFGLDAASGVMRYLAEQKIGFDSGVALVPIVPAAVIFDLALGSEEIHPTAEMGYQACLNATAKRPAQGNVGAGTGASVGKIFAMPQAMKSGVGSASVALTGSLVVAALVVVNAFGDVVDPNSGQILAGVRSPEVQPTPPGSPLCFANTLEVMNSPYGEMVFKHSRSATNTSLGVVATNARLTKEEINKVAQMAHNGFARAIRPVHTMLDGDTIFSLATGEVDGNVNLIGSFAAEVVARACVNAVKTAHPLGGLPGLAG